MALETARNRQQPSLEESQPPERGAMVGRGLNERSLSIVPLSDYQ